MHSFDWGRHLDLDRMAPSLVYLADFNHCYRTMLFLLYCWLSKFPVIFDVGFNKLTSSNITDEQEVLVIFFK